jgi:hypothetical protein
MYLPKWPVSYTTGHGQKRDCKGACRSTSDRTLVDTRVSARNDYGMCRNIKTLFNFEPPATTDEVNASALQFVRKLSGFNKPSKANEEIFNLAVERVSAAAQEMLNSLVTNAPPRDREVDAARAKARAAVRFGR